MCLIAGQISKLKCPLSSRQNREKGRQGLSEDGLCFYLPPTAKNSMGVIQPSFGTAKNNAQNSLQALAE
jgi:hypothetical protein